MTISFVAQGTTPTGVATGTGSTSISPDLPAGIQIGDLLLLVVGCKPDTATIVTPTDWNLITSAQLAGGSGAGQAADAGSVNGAVFYRIAGTTESAPTVSVTSGNSSYAQIFAYRSNKAAPTWQVAACSGADTTSGTSFSATGDADPGITTGDMVLVSVVTPTDGSTHSSESISATGATFATLVERSEPLTTTGNDSGGVVYQMSVTGGPSSAAPVMTDTGSGNISGVAILFRMRESSLAPVSGGLKVMAAATIHTAMW